MNVKIISLNECSAALICVDLVIKTAKKLDITIETEFITVRTSEEAKKYRHIGGPTIQINAKDIEPEARHITEFGIC